MGKIELFFMDNWDLGMTLFGWVVGLFFPMANTV